MLKKYSLKTLQLALNAALTLDEQMPEKLNSLEGKVLKLIINPLEASFFIRFSNKKIQLLDSYDEEPDTIIQKILSVVPTP